MLGVSIIVLFGKFYIVFRNLMMTPYFSLLDVFELLYLYRVYVIRVTYFGLCSFDIKRT